MPVPAALLVTLTGTTNPSITLPADGELTVLEFGRDGLIISAMFRPMAEDGTLAGPCLVPNPVFTYGATYAAGLWRKRQDAAAAADPIGAQVANVQGRTSAGRNRAELMNQNRGRRLGGAAGAPQQ